MSDFKQPKIFRSTRPLIVGLGEVLWDMLPSGRQLGGAPANMVYHAAALGARTVLLSSVGRDSQGCAILKRLDALGINRRFVHKDSAHPTGRVDVLVDSNGHPEYSIRENVAWDFIPFTPAMATLAARADAVCFGTLAQRAPVSRRNLQKFLRHTRKSCLRVFDINLRGSYYSAPLLQRLIGMSNVLKLNNEELPVLARLLALDATCDELPEKLLSRFNLKLLALTRGGNGSLLLTKTECHEEPGRVITIKDTVGAGDSFSAVLTMGLLKGWPLWRINHAANTLAAFVCSRRGATPAIPETLIKRIMAPPHAGKGRAG